MKTNKKVKVGVVQATPALFDIEKTICIIKTWIEKASEEKCEFVLFPESFIPCYPRGLSFDALVGRRSDRSREQWLDYWNNSIDTESEYLKDISLIIKNAGMYVAIGVTEKDNIGGSLHCALWYFDREGRLVGKHRKLKPTGLERYIWGESGGESLVTYNTDIARIGGLICWENYMPMARMSMYEKGVEIYLAPTADSRQAWQNTMQHIALEGRCFVLGCNQFVKKSDYPERYLDDLKDEPGGSVIISPMGEVLAGPLWDQEGLLTAELDFDVLAKSKLDFDVVGHYSRKDVFRYEVLNQPDTLKI